MKSLRGAYEILKEIYEISNGGAYEILKEIYEILKGYLSNP